MLANRSFRSPGRIFAILALGLGLTVAPAMISQAASPKPSTTQTTTQTTKSGGLHTYKTEGEAKSGCHGDTVVWHASGSKVYHTSGSKYYGKTKHGGYACEKAAKADGLKLSKS
ncbi:MAG: hypothetical protein ACREFJ_12155 [Acetobacteraceae bacterium]